MSKSIRVLMLGDIVGRPGRRACIERIPFWRRELDLDCVTANAENASGGNGLSVKNAGELFDCHIDLMTSGNHIWKQKDYPELFEKYPNVIRPANYSDSVPGKGWAVIELKNGVKVGVLNLLGQVFMDPIDSPFSAAEKAVPMIRDITPVIMVDFHAEATSERVAMGLYLDGRVSAIVGTHTHIPTADERVLPGGTAYQTDLGMVGPVDGILGVESGAILNRFLTGLPGRFEVAKGRVTCSGAIINIDAESGRAISIERLSESYTPGTGRKEDE